MMLQVAEVPVRLAVRSWHANVLHLTGLHDLPVHDENLLQLWRVSWRGRLQHPHEVGSARPPVPPSFDTLAERHVERNLAGCGRFDHPSPFALVFVGHR